MLGLGGRVAALVAVVLALGAGAVGLVAYESTKARLLAGVDESLEVTAGGLVAEADAAHGGTGAESAELAELIEVPTRTLTTSLFEVQVLNEEGSVISSSGDIALPVDDRALQLATENAGAELDTVVATVPGNAEQRDYRLLTVAIPGGAVQVGRALTDINEVLTDLGQRTVTVVVIVTLVGTVVGWLVAFGLTDRIRRLTALADQVGRSGRVHVPVPTTGRDEAGRLGRAMDRMLHSLAESRAQQQHLVEDAGHELRTPLTSLRTNMDVLQRHPELPEHIRTEILSELDRDLLELAFLVEEVVEVATHGPEQLQPHRERLGPLVRLVAERMQRRTGRTVTVEADDSEAVIDHRAVQRAVSNLIDNAAKFDTTGGPLMVHVVAGRIWVADRGPGIPPAELNAIFQRFHRTAEARSLPGSGLGLAIVAKVATDHGGSVFARNRAGGGSEVGMVLPVAEGDGPSHDGDRGDPVLT